MKRLLWKLSTLCALSSATFAQQQSTTARAAFAIADVHESPRMMDPYSSGGQIHGDRYILRQSTLVDMIALAYGIKPEMVQGGPSWLELQRFDIVAKADPKTTEAQSKQMLQSLLADRFKLLMHQGEAAMPAYVLTAPGGKTKMKQNESDAPSSCKADPTPPAAGDVPMLVIACTHMSADEIAEFLNQVPSNLLSEPVLDQTGLEGAWDFTLKWTAPRDRARAGAAAVSISDAVAKDLGLKLELKTAPRPVWIVDSVNELPTPNLPAVARDLPSPPYLRLR